MSYILDALRKSQEQHELGRVLRPAQDAAVLAPVRPYLWPLIIGSGVVVALVSLVLWWYVKAGDSAVNPPPSVAAASGATTTATEPQKVQASELKKAAETPTVRQAEARAKPTAAKPAVDGLVEQTRIAPSSAKAGKPAHAGTRVDKAEKQAANVQTPATETTLSDARGQHGGSLTANEPIDWNTVPFLRQMPDDFRNGLPDMVVNVHLYSADQSENLVYINDRQYRRGERIQGRVRLEAIMAEGVVLSHDGIRFKLPRPN